MSDSNHGGDAVPSFWWGVAGGAIGSTVAIGVGGALFMTRWRRGTADAARWMAHRSARHHTPHKQQGVSSATTAAAATSTQGYGAGAGVDDAAGAAARCQGAGWSGFEHVATASATTHLQPSMTRLFPRRIIVVR